MQRVISPFNDFEDQQNSDKSFCTVIYKYETSSWNGLVGSSVDIVISERKYETGRKAQPKVNQGVAFA